MLDPKNLSNGKEQYERFKPRDRRNGKMYVQYDYRDVDGELFSTVRQTLDECRDARDEWLDGKKKGAGNDDGGTV